MVCPVIVPSKCEGQVKKFALPDTVGRLMLTRMICLLHFITSFRFIFYKLVTPVVIFYHYQFFLLCQSFKNVPFFAIVRSIVRSRLRRTVQAWYMAVAPKNRSISSSIFKSVKQKLDYRCWQEGKKYSYKRIPTNVGWKWCKTNKRGKSAHKQWLTINNNKKETAKETRRWFENG